MKNISLRAELQKYAEAVYGLEDNKGWQKKFRLPMDFIGFQGHFPQNPVLPAVIQVLMSEVTLAEAIQKNIRLHTVHEAKFTKPIAPNSLLTCTVTIQSTENGYTWSCTIMDDTTLAAKFRCTGEEL